MRTSLISRAIVSLLCAIIWTGLPAISSAKKQGYSLSVPKQTATQKEEVRMARGSFMVASHCEDCNNGYKISQISFAGFDKPQNSNTETFFITNNTDRTMSGVALYIEYLTPDGRQLHKRYLKLSCTIPPGETRAANIDSWDKQRSFYYDKSAPAYNAGTPFTVVFDPICFYLRF